MGSKRSVALVMPVRNEAGVVDQTLKAIANSTRLPDEVVIADGQSTDNTVELIRAYRIAGVSITVVDNPSLFAGGGRNRAIAATNCDVIVLADFGNVIDPLRIENMVQPFEEDPEMDVVAGWFKPLIESDFEHCMASIHYYDCYVLDRYSEEEKRALVPGAIIPGGLSVAISRRIWESVGGFPEWLKKGQDKMFSRKAHALGAKATVAWNAWIYHHIRSNSKQVFSQLYYYGKGNGQMRYISPHFIKLFGFYSLVFLLLLGGIFSWVSPMLGGLAYLVYYLKSGLKKAYTSDPNRRKLNYLWLTFLPLVSRDFGTILGHVAGWKDWFFHKRFKKLFEDYTKDCNDSINDMIAK